jgi:AcrR family transcriptional regulator
VDVPTYLPHKERIILSAIDIVDEHGFQGLTTREIARRQGISEAALYRHYRNRDDIVAGVLHYFGRFDTSLVESSRLLHGSALDGVCFLISRLAEYYEGYPALSSVLNTWDMMRHDSVASEITNGIYHYRKGAIADLLRKEQSEGRLKDEVVPELLSAAIWSSFVSQVYEWRYSRYAFSLKENAAVMLSMLLKMATKEAG